ncbi:16S rRNA (cytosine(967)-C(5))-methyltransferase RsmB [Emcibacter nanhaiensis]|uniref:16S rRNA (cytosine(967)-C(5))-methyltransferase n=1 Tax=Emcibacter nanhaiensis TaxID=1505037 RepID=A0A501PNU2_9PROT|nr:16S rRNA (cytosine(967)-C(5))-methyltransferase RsmB [Emcibacter nanhaiensis]TPD61441.1 16S rRNA (cytosine(967)-C(5))-methyltransferase RsmB [Emcibacter nanhaiensis]
MAQDLESRLAALYLLEQILDRGQALDGAFENCCRKFSALDQRDRAFVRHLVTTCLRRLGQLNAMINFCTPRNLTPKQARVRHILQLGLTQLLYMEVPAHAAVDSSVRLADSQKNPGDRQLKGLVNAILRRIDRERDVFDEKFSDLFLNVPKWLRNSWLERFGKGPARRIMPVLLEEPPLDLTLKPGENPEAWAEKLGGEVTPFTGVRLKRAGQVEKLSGYDEGAWWVQDLAARLPAELLGAHAGDRVLDLCAAPGGKAVQSAAKGCKVTAVDISEKRLSRLRDNMTRLNLEVAVAVSDAAEYRPDEPFPYILLDAPCSSSGTLRRHPDMAWTKSPADIDSLAEIQRRILRSAVDMLAPGGTLIYCVCSMEAAEGPEQIRALLADDLPLNRDRIRPEELPGLEQSIGPDGDVQTLPWHTPGGMDGFYICRLKKDR